jgi:hypothetical protein
VLAKLLTVDCASSGLDADLLDGQSGAHYLSNRANHTGTQLAATVSDFSEAVDDRVAALLQNGTGLSWSYNDGSNTLTPAVSLAAFSTSNLGERSNLYFTDERAQDAVGAALTDSATIDFTYNDGAGAGRGWLHQRKEAAGKESYHARFRDTFASPFT